MRAWKSLFARDGRGTSKESKNRSRHKTKEVRRENDAPKQETSLATASAPRGSNRLGKSDLGRFAYEHEMPAWLVRLLNGEGQVQAAGIIGVLQRLLEQNEKTKYAYLCHQAVEHISKLKREGGFCGYRNIQMLTSYMIGAQDPSCSIFGDSPPTIFQIQEMIEQAWDDGFNPRGRIETGGIKGTRKYIGTPEAQALFCSLGIPCAVQAFKDPKDHQRARRLLFRAIEEYFSSGSEADSRTKVRCTSLPPIYFQRPGHSMTIVGLERDQKNNISLLVFDPSYQDSDRVLRVFSSESPCKTSIANAELGAYRRGSRQLRKYGQFEVLYLTSDTESAE